jgi:hypothetical protein
MHIKQYRYHYHTNGTEPPIVDTNPWIFVFGSNMAGIHGAGAALLAVNFYGARNGVSMAQEGRSYAIPTKDERIRTLSLKRISEYAQAAIRYMSHRISNAHQRYWFTAVGTGLAGYQHEDIAPMFETFRTSVVGDLTEHLSFPEEWREFLEPDAYHEQKLQDLLFKPEPLDLKSNAEREQLMPVANTAE